MKQEICKCVGCYKVFDSSLSTWLPEDPLYFPPQPGTQKHTKDPYCPECVAEIETLIDELINEFTGICIGTA